MDVSNAGANSAGIAKNMFMTIPTQMMRWNQRM